MREALELGAAALRPNPAIFCAHLVATVRVHLDLDLRSGATARVEDPTIERAARSFAKSRRSWEPILDLAKAIRAVGRDTTSASLRQTLAREA